MVSRTRGCIVFKTDIAHEGEFHRCCSRHLLLEVALPGLSLALRAKTSFRLLLRLASPVLVSEVGKPSSSLLVLVSCHDLLLSLRSAMTKKGCNMMDVERVLRL